MTKNNKSTAARSSSKVADTTLFALPLPKTTCNARCFLKVDRLEIRMKDAQARSDCLFRLSTNYALCLLSGRPLLAAVAVNDQVVMIGVV